MFRLYMITKLCSKCKIEKSILEFSKHNQNNGYRPDCKICNGKINKKYRTENKSKRKLAQQNYYINNKAKVNIQKKKYYSDNKKQIQVHRNIYRRNKRKLDINFRLSDILRNRTRQVLKNNFKSQKTLELLGCSIEFLKIHLESKFTNGMSWDNYGYYGWHIDHIKPCSKFDLSIPEQQKICFHYLNLQPLWKEDNQQKGNRLCLPVNQ